MTENKRFMSDGWKITDNTNDEDIGMIKASDLLNELHEDNEWLELNNRELVDFIKSKGYSLKDFIDYIGEKGEKNDRETV